MFFCKMNKGISNFKNVFEVIDVRIVRDGYNGDGHISEKALDSHKFTVRLENNSTVEELFIKTDKLWSLFKSRKQTDACKYSE